MAGVPRRQDARSGPRGLQAEIAPVHDLDPQPLARQKIRGGQANDAAADDHHVSALGHAVVIYNHTNPKRQRGRSSLTLWLVSGKRPWKEQGRPRLPVQRSPQTWTGSTRPLGSLGWIRQGGRPRRFAAAPLHGNTTPRVVKAGDDKALDEGLADGYVAGVHSQGGP